MTEEELQDLYLQLRYHHDDSMARQDPIGDAYRKGYVTPGQIPFLYYSYAQKEEQTAWVAGRDQHMADYVEPLHDPIPVSYNRF